MKFVSDCLVRPKIPDDLDNYEDLDNGEDLDNDEDLDSDEDEGDKNFDSDKDPDIDEELDIEEDLANDEDLKNVKTWFYGKLIKWCNGYKHWKAKKVQIKEESLPMT